MGSTNMLEAAYVKEIEQIRKRSPRLWQCHCTIHHYNYAMFIYIHFIQYDSR